MGKKKVKPDEYSLTHDAFFEEMFQMPSLGIAFLKRLIPGFGLTLFHGHFYDANHAKYRENQSI
ncbi:MAG: hypothetical protein FWH27_15660 [Planctomycetaceae bacterium]|nr:hypothetical protein [Planctomycetaceae bacterium]